MLMNHVNVLLQTLGFFTWGKVVFTTGNNYYIKVIWIKCLFFIQPFDNFTCENDPEFTFSFLIRLIFF